MVVISPECIALARQLFTSRRDRNLCREARGRATITLKQFSFVLPVRRNDAFDQGICANIRTSAEDGNKSGHDANSHAANLLFGGNSSTSASRSQLTGSKGPWPFAAGGKNPQAKKERAGRIAPSGPSCARWRRRRGLRSPCRPCRPCRRASPGRACLPDVRRSPLRW